MASASSSPLVRQYQRTQAETAAPLQLVIMLYDGAIRFLSLAREKMVVRDLEARHIYLLKAQRIIGELMGSLDRDKGGAVAENLHGLYAYMLQQLVEANLKDQLPPIDKVIEMLRDLRGTWAAVEEQIQKGTGKGEA